MKLTGDQIKKLAFAVYSHMSYDELLNVRQEMLLQLQAVGELIESKRQPSSDVCVLSDPD